MQSAEEQSEQNFRKPISFINTKKIPKRVEVDFRLPLSAAPEHPACAFCGREAKWSLIALVVSGQHVGANYCHKCLIEKALALRKILKEAK